MAGLTNLEIMKIVNRYIGVFGGYLGDFSYRTHADFYPEYCELDIDPYQIEGTTRERFIFILKSQLPVDQAKILRGVLERFPVGDKYAPDTRTQALWDEIEQWAKRLEQSSPIPNPSPQITSTIVVQALTDAENLIQTSGAASAVDRVHTALHGYLREVCKQTGITYSRRDGISQLFQLLRQQHPSFQMVGARNQDVERMLDALGNTLDALNTLRNHASLAHPNPVLDEEDAMLAINATRSIFHYLDAKF